ncbi:MAG: AAA family ATPase [Brevinematia bacterium]
MAVKGNYKRIKKLVKTSLSANLPVLILGHPGCGKSTMAKELAQEFGLPLIDIRLAHEDPAELTGVRVPDKDTSKLVVYVPDWVPTDKPVFLFLDEINAGVTKLHQACAYQIVLDRRAKSVPFHPETKVIAAGNLEEDNAIVTPLSQALNNRFVHFELVPDIDCWLDWAKNVGITPVTRAYIAFRGIKGLYNNTGERAFPSPRSIEMADKVYREAKKAGLKKDEIRDLIAACIGQGDAVQFIAFEEIYSEIKIEDVVKTGIIPKNGEVSFLYALTFGIASFVRDKLSPKDIRKYEHGLTRFAISIPREYLVLFVKEIADKSNIFNAIVEIFMKNKELLKEIDIIQESIKNFE